jgi:hypothetical protein
MIPYIIKQARPIDDTCYDNVIIELSSSRCKEDLNKDIIDYISTVMYEFCSEEYGHDIKITSYSDFCEKYWKTLEMQLKYWDSVFEVYYFENNWIKWDITAYQDKIWLAYNKK